MDTEQELRATSDALLANLERLRRLELEKRSLPAGSSGLVDVAEEIDRLAELVLGASDRQVKLASKQTDLAEEGVIDPDTTIEDVSRTQDVHEILAAWRDAERKLAALPPDSREALAARARVEALRRAYRAAHDAAVRRNDRPT
jgi:hypothetical protein